MKRIISLLPLVLILACTAAAASALIPDKAHHPGSTHPKPPSKRVAKQLKAAKLATLKFRDPEAAKAAGYTPTEDCVSDAVGGMGEHWINVALIADPALDPAKPEILLYAPKPGGGVQ